MENVAPNCQILNKLYPHFSLCKWLSKYNWTLDKVQHRARDSLEDFSPTGKIQTSLLNSIPNPTSKH